MGVLTWDFMKKSKKSLGLLWSAIIFIASVVLMQFLNIHPAILIVVLLGAAFLPSRKKSRKKEAAHDYLLADLHFLFRSLGYGGGPSSLIPLVENEVVGRYGWLTVSEFSEVLALGNALPVQLQQKWLVTSATSKLESQEQSVALFQLVAPFAHFNDRFTWHIVEI